MNAKQYNKARKLLNEIASINTWTARKHLLFNKVIQIMKSGTHEFFRSKPRFHCDHVGSYYTENKSHKRKGTLFKYRGCQVLVVCYRRGSWNTREFLVSVVK